MANTAATTIPTQAKKHQTRSERSEYKKRSAKALVQAQQTDNDEQTNAHRAATNAFADKKNIMWVLLSGAMALTFVVMLFLPDTGMGSGLISTYAAMMWCGFFGAAVWRYKSASGWAGFAYGSVIGLVIQFISQFM